MTKPQLEKALAKQAAQIADDRPSHAARPGELPFTGFPGWLAAIIGSLMLAAGLAIRRLAN
jgi:hypothetical protein